MEDEDRGDELRRLESAGSSKRRDDEIDLAEVVVMADFLVLSCYEGYSRPRSFAHRPPESYASKKASTRKAGQILTLCCTSPDGWS